MNALSYSPADIVIQRDLAVREFTLDELGVAVADAARRLRPYFDALPWDLYELRGRQWARLYWDAAAPSADAGLKVAFLDGRVALDELPAFRRLSDARAAGVAGLRPRRRRAIAAFALERTARGGGDGWRVRREAAEAFEQAESDFYPGRRRFAAMDERAIADDAFGAILLSLPDRLAETGVDARGIRVVCHQVALAATADTPGHGAPEGIHQDGADFIVPALIVHRENVEGGVSRVFRRTADGALHPVYARALEPGHALFHADRGTDLWHDVTPITPADPSRPGLRSSLGFDVNVPA